MKSFLAIQTKLRWGSHMCAHNGNRGFMRTYITCYIGTEDRSSCSQFFSKRVFLKFRKFHWKIRSLQSLFNKVAGLKACKACNFIKRDSNTGAFL